MSLGSSPSATSAFIRPDRDTFRNFGQSCAGLGMSRRESSGAVRVRIAIGAQQNFVAWTGRGTISISLTPMVLRELRCEPKLLIRHSAGSDDRDFPAGKCRNCTAAWSMAMFQSAGISFPSEQNFRLKQSSVRLQIFEIQAPVIAHPAGINGVVLARCLAINDIFARADEWCCNRSRNWCRNFSFPSETKRAS